MNFLHNYFLLMSQALSGIIGFWPICICVSVPLIIGLLLNNPFSPEKYKRKHLLVLSPFIIPFLMLLIGTLFQNDQMTPALKWPLYILIALGSMHLPLTLFLIYYLKGFRWFVIGITFFQIWCSFMAYFVSGMSVTGDWI